MAKKYVNPTKVVTGECRFSYANLWEAKAMDENSKPKYSVSLIIPKSVLPCQENGQVKVTVL